MTVQVRESVKRKLEEMAEKRGVSLADLVRDVLGAGISQMRD